MIFKLFESNHQDDVELNEASFGYDESDDDYDYDGFELDDEEDDEDYYDDDEDEDDESSRPVKNTYFDLDGRKYKWTEKVTDPYMIDGENYQAWKITEKDGYETIVIVNTEDATEFLTARGKASHKDDSDFDFDFFNSPRQAENILAKLSVGVETGEVGKLEKGAEFNYPDPRTKAPVKFTLVSPEGDPVEVDFIEDGKLQIWSAVDNSNRTYYFIFNTDTNAIPAVDTLFTKVYSRNYNELAELLKEFSDIDEEENKVTDAEEPSDEETGYDYYKSGSEDTRADTEDDDGLDLF